MKALVLFALVACAAALPLEEEAPAATYLDYTKEVADARADFQAAFDAAAAGEGPVASYLDYTKEVADARADFQAAYDAAAANEGPVASYLDYTKEVADARADFQAIHDAAAARPKINPLLYPYGIHAPVLAASTLAAGAPLTYSGLGFPGAFGLNGFYGPYGFPFQLAKAE
ncbi:uncharacterized protein [Panulirus ornatus]|uniref:uncharacterized protein n=1 Tax=Panulirus ornatus TaxID=150431 RepID=UPI003A8456DF